MQSLDRLFFIVRTLGALIAGVGFCAIYMVGCNGAGKDSHENDRKLANTYCATCHAMPEPSLLTRQTWKKDVLPLMGMYLGIKPEQESTGWDRPVEPPAGAPDHPLLSTEEWNRIVSFYIKEAPDSFPHNYVTITDSLFGFSFEEKMAPAAYQPAVSSLKIDTFSAQPNLLVADLNQQLLSKYNPALHKTDSLYFGDGAIVGVSVLPNGLFLCNVGVLRPNNGRSGKSEQVFFNASGKMRRDSVPLINELARPVQIIPMDLDKDGKMDYLVCEFGHVAGALSWRKNLGNNQFESKIIRALPGASNLHIRDVNADGLPDIWAMFAQGDEGIFLFVNQGGGQFKEQRVLRFPPAYGSSSYELVDVDGDGREDIIYTCGDNSDFSPILKPYHGVYIYLNRGNMEFEKSYFFAINGCYKTVTADFDKDGDMDIASISFFADYKERPEEGFVYLKNEGGLRFTPYSFKQSQRGRWLTMDAGDLDSDGDLDIVIGNLSIGPYNIASEQDWKSGPQFILLRNETSNTKARKRQP